MDLHKNSRAVLGCFLILSAFFSNASANFVFSVSHKFNGRDGRSLSELKAHDSRRHGRILAGSASAVDVQLGGNGRPSGTGLYFAKLGIGTPSKDYFVQVDTGSDIMWVNCITCTDCPKKNDIGVKLTLYDPKGSSSSNAVTCDQDFCTSQFKDQPPACQPNMPCSYDMTYGDGSETMGNFVKDNVQFDKGTDGNVVFGCGTAQSGQISKSSSALDGIIGFGQANSSVFSQLAASGKVKKQFAHCLDNVRGGGIFAMGEVVEPKVNDTTPLVPGQAHYNVVLETIEVGGEVVQLASDVFDTGSITGTIIDSGTTLAYLPQEVFDPMMQKILAKQPDLKISTVDNHFTCFEFSNNLDDGFPLVKFNFNNSASLTVYPHDYLFKLKGHVWCSGWQSSGMKSASGESLTLLGDLVLSNKLVIYDVENQMIGWTDYNCSSSIKVRNEKTGTIDTISAHNLSSASVFTVGRLLLTFFLLISAVF
ncbi:aspartic proteinase 36-like [Malus sylvestris]|uniref:aspartic proteinase 36-like n=1 Tax=Malus sylvestris TaxID=3752 RepID=UPI0021AC8B0E|nr:aspartic proteinase 36-like [Malus sylvestris]